MTLVGCVLVCRPALIRLRPYLGRGEAGGEDSMCFLCQIITPDIRTKPRYTDAFWGEHPFDGHMILIKNKNMNKYIQRSTGMQLRLQYGRAIQKRCAIDKEP